MTERNHSDAIVARLMLALGLALLAGLAAAWIDPTTLRVEHRVDRDWHAVEGHAIRLDRYLR